METHNKGFVREMFGFLIGGKRWWLVAIVIALLAAGILIIFAQSSAISPFIYSLL